jgi:hypothetical protein
LGWIWMSTMMRMIHLKRERKRFQNLRPNRRVKVDQLQSRMKTLLNSKSLRIWMNRRWLTKWTLVKERQKPLWRLRSRTKWYWISLKRLIRESKTIRLKSRRWLRRFRIEIMK